MEMEEGIAVGHEAHRRLIFTAPGRIEEKDGENLEKDVVVVAVVGRPPSLALPP